MQRVGEHLVPAGPLAPRWQAWTLGPQRAGTISTGRITVENAGSATWRSHGAGGVQASYHWLDPLGNPIVWDGIRTPLPTTRRAGRDARARAAGTRPAAAGPLPARDRPRRGASILVFRDRLRDARGRAGRRVETDRATACGTSPRRLRRRHGSRARGAGGADRRRRGERRRGASGRGRGAAAGLVAARPRRPRRGMGGGRASRSCRNAAIAHSHRGRPERSQPSLRASAAAPVPAGRDRAVGASRTAGLRRRRGPLRRPDRDQISAAIRSSTRLNTNAPSSRATAVSTSR